MYYFCNFGDGMNFWVNKFKEDEMKFYVKFDVYIGVVMMDKEGKNIYCVVDGKLIKIDFDKVECKDILFNVEMMIDGYVECVYLFEYMWCQVVKKFYVIDLQKIDWNYYKMNYVCFLLYINNNCDFVEMMSELFGELNVFYMGCCYNLCFKNVDEMVSLGVFFDESFIGNGLKIEEVLVKGLFVKIGIQIKVGMIIEKIDGVEIIF